MKTSLAILTLLFAATAATAQVTADIEVSYTEHHPNFRNGKADLTSQYILLANVTESKFYSPKTEYIDSLNSTPEGQAKLHEMSKDAYLSGNLDRIPQKDGNFYVTKDFTKRLMRSYDNAGMEKYYVDEPFGMIDCAFGDSAKTILGYECSPATIEYHGRQWTLWFTPDIPIANGPWKLGGLPGLILEAVADDGQYRFIATGIQRSENPVGAVYLADEYEKIDRISLLKAKRAFIENPFGQINARFGEQGSYVDENGNELNTGERLYVTRDKADFLETDY